MKQTHIWFSAPQYLSNDADQRYLYDNRVGGGRGGNERKGFAREKSGMGEYSLSLSLSTAMLKGDKATERRIDEM
jgi:hypothetical protein